MRVPLWVVCALLSGPPLLVSGQGPEQNHEPLLHQKDGGVLLEGNSELARVLNQAMASGTSGRLCSVPLLEAPIAADQRFTIKELRIPADTRSKDTVPPSSLPAPPCPKK